MQYPKESTLWTCSDPREFMIGYDSRTDVPEFRHFCYELAIQHNGYVDLYMQNNPTVEAVLARQELMSA